MIGMSKLKQGLYHLDISKHVSLTSPKVFSINHFTTLSYYQHQSLAL